MALSLAAAGCGGDDEKTIVEQRTVTDTVTATTPEQTTATGTTGTDTGTTTSSTPSGPTDCGSVNVELGQGSEGGATSVKATALDCGQALGVMRECIKGSVPSGWSVGGELGSPVLERGSQTVSGTLAGGGGCQPVE